MVYYKRWILGIGLTLWRYFTSKSLTPGSEICRKQLVTAGSEKTASDELHASHCSAPVIQTAVRDKHTKSECSTTSWLMSIQTKMQRARKKLGKTVSLGGTVWNTHFGWTVECKRARVQSMAWIRFRFSRGPLYNRRPARLWFRPSAAPLVTIAIQDMLQHGSFSGSQQFEIRTGMRKLRLSGYHPFAKLVTGTLQVARH
jgi:hypothetical protein